MQDYELLMNSGLYDELVGIGLLVKHVEVESPKFDDLDYYKTIKPIKINFISHPYEWSFSQLKDAALLTLDIQLMALKYGMSLKDASAYNIQFTNGKPILIDTLSFERIEERDSWVAYRQFCQHFLAPLVLMAKTDIRLSQLSRIFIDGIPLDLTSRLLPLFSWFRWGLLSHLHLHAKAQAIFGDTRTQGLSGGALSKKMLVALIESLRTTVLRLEWKFSITEWSNYYESTNYIPSSLNFKEKFVEECLDEVKPLNVWDFGANTGNFSRIASRKNIHTVAFDLDPAAVEKIYKLVKHSKEKCFLPLVLDLTNPSPSLGWGSVERAGLVDRGPVNGIIALALIHHMVITNNVPISRLASFLAANCEYLIIEFVPKSDSQVERLLLSRKDIFSNYNQFNFEIYFSQYFSLKRKSYIPGSKRTLYLMQKK
jgi:ribosomal protein L11 methylase PrmA